MGAIYLAETSKGVFRILKDMYDGTFNTEAAKIQKQPSRGAFSKRYSKNMLEIYRRTLMLKIVLQG